MLRSLYSGISGLRSHQTMLDVTGNNIANVNTTGFKAGAVQFQDTLSQLTQAAGGQQVTAGGTNPAQVGLGVQIAGISTNFTQGSTQATGRPSDMLIAGDGFFITQQGGEALYTRSGAFDFDGQGRLVTPGGALVQGWSAVDGVIAQGGPVGNIVLQRGAVSAATATTTARATGNLPGEAAVGTTVEREIEVFDATGNPRDLTLTFTRTAGGWDVDGNDGSGGTGTGALAFTDGALTGGGSVAIGGITVDLTGTTSFAGLSNITIAEQNGQTAGTLESYSLGKDGTLIGSFSNGESQAMGRIALATFVNPGGLEKAGGSGYRVSANSGAAQVNAPGEGGVGGLVSGALEMSNVDLSQEFTNLIVAQRGFQANARIITTSDEVLQELSNLKR